MKKKKMSKFKMGIMIYAGVSVLLIAIFAVIFWNFIADYEKSMPHHGVDKVLADMNASEWDKYFETKTQDGAFESTDKIKEYILEKYDGKKITSKKAKSYTASKPVFELLADGKAFASVTLKKTGKNKSNFSEWGYDSISYEDYIKYETYTIEAPSTTKVSVNGVELSDEYKKEEKEIERLSQAALYTTGLPKMAVYEVELIYEPDVTAVDSKGNTVEAVKDNNTYTIGFAPSDDVEAEHKEYALKVSSVYVKNFINVKEGILKYIMPDSELREAVRLSDTYFYPVEYMAGYEFLKQEVKNFVYYSEDCFSCDVYYEVNVLFRGWSISSKVEVSDINYVFVKKDGTWYLTSLSYN